LAYINKWLVGVFLKAPSAERARRSRIYADSNQFLRWGFVL